MLMKFNYFLMGVKLMSINKGSFNWYLVSRAFVWGGFLGQKVTSWCSPPTGPTELNIQNKKNLKFININLWSVKYGCPRGSPQMGYTKLAA